MCAPGLTSLQGTLAIEIDMHWLDIGMAIEGGLAPHCKTADIPMAALLAA